MQSEELIADMQQLIDIRPMLRCSKDSVALANVQHMMRDCMKHTYRIYTSYVKNPSEAVKCYRNDNS